MNFSQFLEWGFLGLISGGVIILWQMKESLVHLNSKIEVLIVQHENLKNNVDDHEGRLRQLER